MTRFGPTVCARSRAAKTSLRYALLYGRVVAGRSDAGKGGGGDEIRCVASESDVWYRSDHDHHFQRSSPKTHARLATVRAQMVEDERIGCFWLLLYYAHIPEQDGQDSGMSAAGP